MKLGKISDQISYHMCSFIWNFEVMDSFYKWRNINNQQIIIFISTPLVEKMINFVEIDVKYSDIWMLLIIFWLLTINNCKSGKSKSNFAF